MAVITGTAAADELFGTESGDSIAGLAGDDTLYGAGGSDAIEGGGGNDSSFGDGGNDKLNGGAGNDTLDGGAGTDTMWGGKGDDFYFVNSAGDVVIEKSGQGIDTIISSVTRTLGGHQENLTLIGGQDRNGTGNSLNNVIDGNDAVNTLDGESGHDTINGNGGDDTIFGGSGNDSIDGGDGADSMIGGSGSDTYFVGSGQGDVVVEELGDSGVDTIITNGSINMADHGHVENLVWLNDGGGGGFCSGNELDNVMTVNSGAGTLTMDGNGGIDTLTYEGQAGAVEVDLEAGNATFVDTLEDMENAIGGLGNDTLTGNGVANVLDGSGGADEMAGGYGGDTYVVDDIGDVVTEIDNVEAALVLGGSGHGLAVGDITDTVLAAIDYALTDFVEHLKLTGSALTGTGNDENNVITGNSLANTLDGLAGEDTLIGAGGNDILVWQPGESPAGIYNGGNGTDTLRVRTDSDGDSIDLTQAGSNAILSVERVDLRGGSDNTLTLTRADVLAMSPKDTVTVRGDEGDQVVATGFRQFDDVGSLNQYRSKTAVLLVESDVTVVT